MALATPQIVLAVLLPFILLTSNLFLFARLLDPEDFRGALLTKSSAFLGVCLVEASLLLLPFDLATEPSATAGAWQAILIALFAHVVVIAPLQLFYYEAQDDEDSSRPFSPAACGSALLSSCGAWALTAIGLGVGYHYMATAYVPLHAFSIPASALVPASPALAIAPATCAFGPPAPGVLCPAGGAGAPAELPVPVSFIVFLGAIFTFVGWLFFACWLGAGLVALPISLIQAFLFRPRPLTAARAAAVRRALNAKASELLLLGEAMEAAFSGGLGATRSRGEARGVLRAHRGDVARLRLLVQAAEGELEAWQLSDPAEWRRSYNPLKPFAALACGIVAAAFSAAWFFHICVFMLPRPSAHPFLGSLLRQLAPLPLAPTVTLMALNVYLLLAVVKGIEKLGTRMCLLAIHPLEPGKTLSNALLFNVAMLELCAFPAVQFVCIAFPTYVSSSAVDALMGGAYENLSWLRFFCMNNVNLFLILLFVVIGAVWACACPTQRAELARATRMLAERKARERLLLERKIARAGGALEGLEMTAPRGL